MYGAGAARGCCALRPFYCDLVGQDDGGNWVNKTAQSALFVCSKASYENNPSRDPTKCAPWDQVYGMYFGDEDGKSQDIIREITSIFPREHGSESAEESAAFKGPAVGNYLIGKSSFEHAYYVDMDEPYTAYFTGGDRVYECAKGNIESGGYMDEFGRCTNPLQLMLNNNAEVSTPHPSPSPPSLCLPCHGDAALSLFALRLNRCCLLQASPSRRAMDGCPAAVPTLRDAKGGDAWSCLVPCRAGFAWSRPCGSGRQLADISGRRPA